MTDILLIGLVVVYLVLTGMQMYNLRELRQTIEKYITRD
jgi:hypothetical protein